MSFRLLALLPYAAILVGVAFCNRVTPMLFGLPLILAWLVFCILLTATVMAVIHRLDGQRRSRGTGHPAP